MEDLTEIIFELLAVLLILICAAAFVTNRKKKIKTKLKHKKLLIVDKNIFHGTSNEQMSQFAHSYNILLPHALAIECLISKGTDGKAPIGLLKRLEDSVKAGAHVGLSPFTIIKKEKENKKAVDCIVDHDATAVIKESSISLNESLVEEEASKANQAFLPMIEFCQEIAQRNYDNLKKKNLQKGFREEINESDCASRLKKWIQATDKLKDGILESQLPEINGFVTDNNSQWFSWQLLRLYFAWALEWACRRNNADSLMDNQDISNDFFDMEYVALLCKADGLLSNDQCLVVPLAKAAFPEKDVFPTIDEIPDGYKD